MSGVVNLASGEVLGNEVALEALSGRSVFTFRKMEITLTRCFDVAPGLAGIGEGDNFGGEIFESGGCDHATQRGSTWYTDFTWCM